MVENLKFNRLPDPLGQAQCELQNAAKLISAFSELKTCDPVHWHFLFGMKSISGFTGIPYSRIRHLVRAG